MLHSILIVDDSTDDRDLTKMVLVQTGFPFELQEASCGEEAVRSLKNTASLPGLILIDLKMPGMSGIDTLRTIRNDLRLEHIPIVILTNSTLESDREIAQRAGADDYLQKGFDIVEFAKDLKRVLQRCLPINRQNGNHAIRNCGDLSQE